MCFYLYFPKDTIVQKIRELFNISTTTDECRLWIYGCAKKIVKTCLLIARDFDSVLGDKELVYDDVVRIRYIHSIIYFLFVLGGPYINVRNKKSRW